MKKALRIVPVFLLLAMLAGGLLPATSSSEMTNLDAGLPTVTAAVIVCRGEIGYGLYKSIQRRTEIAIDAGIEYLIYEMDTLGGGLLAAYKISEYFLHEVNPRVHTVAYVSKKAISAGALISVACEDIIMKDNTRIGDCAPIALGTKLDDVEREKVETDIRAVFVNSAKANNYPEAVLRAMVTRQIEVYRVRSTSTGEYVFFEGSQIPMLDAEEYDLDNKTLIVTKDQLLTLTASEALEYGVARAEVTDVAGVLEFLAKDDGVSFVGEPRVFETTWSEEMVRWLNSPAVVAVLVMLAMLGVYIELSTPGVGLPGLVAVVCLTIIIGSKYLWGLANWVEVTLFVVGIVLLVVEIFVLPGFGIAGILGIVFILAGLFSMLIENPPDRLPWPETALDWQVFMKGMVGLSLGLVGFIVLAWLLARYLPKLQFLSGLILVPTAAIRGGEMRVSMTAPPESKTTAINIGDIGEVTSTLRPTGKAIFRDAVVDVVATAEFIDEGTKVEIVEIHGNRVVVKRVEDQPEE